MGRDTGGVKGMGLRKGDEVITVGRRRGQRRRAPRRDRERIRKADQARGLPAKRPRRAWREDRATDRGPGPARRRQDRPGRLPGDVDLERRDRDQDPVEDVKRLGRSTQGVIVMRLRKANRSPPLLRSSSRRKTKSPLRATVPDAGSGDRTGLKHRNFKRFPGRGPSQRRPRAIYLHVEGFHLRREKNDGRQQTSRSSRADRSCGASRQDPALSGPGVPDRRHLEDAARLLDEQGSDPNSGPQAAHLRHGRARDRDVDQAGQGQGTEPRRGDRGGAALPRAERLGERLGERPGRRESSRSAVVRPPLRAAAS